MPKRTDISKILILGSGPIVIGQSAEFDYSGTQACKALKSEGFEVVLANSNGFAILPTVGGQTALNLAIELADGGVLEKYNVHLIGAQISAIKKAEDRLFFKDAMQRIGLDVPKSALVSNLKDGVEFAGKIGFPVIIRPSFTLGGTGGGIAYNREELMEVLARGLDLSPVHECLIEESVLGWKEYELEVMRDTKDNVIIICPIENFDPMGVHTGDSITVAPAQTLTDREYQMMRDASIAVIREIGVETGGSNIQFGVNPSTGRMVVIEMNPRVSRSSARCVDCRDPRDWRRDRRVEYPVWRQSFDRTHGGDRNEPARVAVIGACVKSHWLPDCEDRREACRRLYARRDSERHHAQDSSLLRAHTRLCGRQDSEVAVRKISRR